MKIVVQRVKKASVSVSGNEISSIRQGMLLLVGIGKGDSMTTADQMADKVSRLRIFEDDACKMNLDIFQVKGEILSVSQFTLLADMSKGNRPGFDNAAEPAIAKELWLKFNDKLRQNGITTKEGEFAADMQVLLVNDGPVTILLDSK